jgi:hypothetical protein
MFAKKTTGAGGPPPMLSAVRRTDNKLLAYARSAYGTVDLSEEDWIKCEDHYKVGTLFATCSLLFNINLVAIFF